MIPLLFLTLLALSVAGYAAAAFALARVARRYRRSGWSCFTPGVSIVKPLSGLDDELERNLESFYRLDYPEYEVVFSFARRTDPAFEVARRVADRHPSVPSTFVVDAREAGANARSTGWRPASRGRVFATFSWPMEMCMWARGSCPGPLLPSRTVPSAWCPTCSRREGRGHSPLGSSPFI